MRDPATVLNLVEVCTGKLDTLSKMLADAHDEATHAEEAWDVVWDTVATDLLEEYREKGRKTDPAEHVIKSAARRLDRGAYQRWRRSRREVDKLEKVAQNRRQELSGYQSELSLAKAEAQASVGPQPQWTAGTRGLPQGAKDRALTP